MPNRFVLTKSTSDSALTPTSSADLKLPAGITIGTFKAPDGEDIGISDGRFAFDTAPDRLDKDLKAQLPEVFKNNDKGQINALLQQATTTDTNDAEAKIYDEWRYQNLSDPPFFKEYVQAFNDTSRSHPVYGYTRSDGSSMEGYDATSVIEAGIQLALANNTKENVTRDGLQNALSQLKGSQSVQGVTGQISFNVHHDPDNKVTLVLHATDKGIQIVYKQGCFLKGNC